MKLTSLKIIHIHHAKVVKVFTLLPKSYQSKVWWRFSRSPFRGRYSNQLLQFHKSVFENQHLSYVSFFLQRQQSWQHARRSLKNKNPYDFLFPLFQWLILDHTIRIISLLHSFLEALQEFYGLKLNFCWTKL